MHPILGLVAIVEDDTAMRRSLERLLQASGYETVTFASGEAFWESSMVSRAIAVVLDIHLGAMSGIELRRRLSAAKSPIPVVFITAYDDEVTRREALAAGCVAFLLKPFDAHRLTAALERSRQDRPNQAGPK